MPLRVRLRKLTDLGLIYQGNPRYFAFLARIRSQGLRECGRSVRKTCTRPMSKPWPALFQNDVSTARAELAACPKSNWATRVTWTTRRMHALDNAMGLGSMLLYHTRPAVLTYTR